MTDYPTSQLIPILRKILSKLQDVVLQLEFKNKNDTQHNEQEARERDRAANLAVSPIPIEVHSLPTKSDDDRTYQKEKRSLERKKFIIEIVTLIALSVYTTVAGIQACMTKRAIKDNEDSFNKTLAQMKAQTCAQQRAASAAATQAEASLRSAKAQETANRLVSHQFEIMQSSDLALKGMQSAQGVTWQFTNTGRADITDLVIRREIKHFQNMQSEDCREFDPIKYLDEFRLDPDRYKRQWMENWKRAWKNNPSTANDKGLESEMSPHRIYKRIHQGEGVSFSDMLGQDFMAVTFEFFLADWDDPFGHHSDQFCNRVEGAPTSLQILSCSAPMGYAPSKKTN